MKINQKDINNAAWAACDSFRGAVDPAQYKDYILVMLFLKYISDVWQDHYQNYKQQFGEDEQRIQRRLGRERFILPMVEIRDPNNDDKLLETFRANFSSLYKRRSASNIGDLINQTLDAIEEANKAKLEGVFRNIDFNSEANLGKIKDRNRRLEHLLKDFHKPELDMSPSRVSEDVIGNTYIYLIERFGSDAGKKAGEFYTPHSASELLARLAAPKPGDRICDVSCGSGSLLLEAAKEVGSQDYQLFGMEVNGSTWALARMNMFLHGADSARIEWCNTLTAPLLIENDRLMKFDVVVANPPFSLDKWGAKEVEDDRFKRFHRGMPPKSKGDYAFISHMLAATVEREGRVAVICPHGVLFRGAAEGRIRTQLIEDNLLDAVIGLPGNLFATTGIPVAILIFDRSRERGGINQNRNDVLFIDASRGFVAEKTRNSLSDDHIERIVDTYQLRKSEDKYSHLASLDEIRENDFNLNIPRYVDTFEEEEPVDVQAVQKDIESIEKEIALTRAKMAVHLKALGIEVAV